LHRVAEIVIFPPVLPHPLLIPGGLRNKRARHRGLLLAALCLIACGGCSGFIAQGRNAEGVGLFEAGQYQAALAQFQEATTIDPTNADGYYNQAATFHRLGRLQGQPTDLDRAEACYRQCLQRQPNHVEGHRGLAVLLAEKGRGNEAIQMLAAWAEQQPWLADPKIELARLYDELGDRAAAEERLVEAVRVDPNNPRSWAALGKLREEAGQCAQALWNYQRSLQLDEAQPELAARVAVLDGLAAQPCAPAPPAPTRSVSVPPVWR
jgi:tetratricopeptide (TPR) repeat protein